MMKWQLHGGRDRISWSHKLPLISRGLGKHLSLTEKLLILYSFSCYSLTTSFEEHNKASCVLKENHPGKCMWPKSNGTKEEGERMEERQTPNCIFCRLFLRADSDSCSPFKKDNFRLEVQQIMMMLTISALTFWVSCEIPDFLHLTLSSSSRS